MLNSDAEKCEVCGSKTEYRIEASTKGLFCTQCDWSVVSTCIPEIEQDIIKYKVFLLPIDNINKDKIKVLAKAANINLIQAKKMYKERKPFILEAEAIEVNEVRKIFDDWSINYVIEPDFPY